MTDHERDLTICPDCGQPYVRAWLPVRKIETVVTGDTRAWPAALFRVSEMHKPCPARRTPAVGGEAEQDGKQS